MQFSTRGFRLAMALVAVLTVSARADDPPKGDGMAAARPTKEHELLAKDVGVWDAEVRVFYGGPDAPPGVSKGTETVTALPGGLWFFGDFKGEVAGAPFFGRGQTGYDPRKKKFLGTWVDSMSPGLSLLEGTYDEKARALTLTGDFDDPATGKTMKQRMVTEYKADGTHVFSLYVISEETKGAEVKFMEILYTRHK